MSNWDDPEHLRPGRQTGRLEAWRDEDQIWVHRTRIMLMQQFSEHPGRFVLGTILLVLLLVAGLTLVSAYARLNPFSLPGGSVVSAGIAYSVWRFRRRRK
jgi:hypothetical protein